jgi:nicotinate-nucleotide adenylyltransferase
MAALTYGILGGSFDPIHLGHVAAAEAALRRRGLAAVFLIPAGHAPHKPPCEASFADRLEMARLGARGRPGLHVLDLEGARPGPSFTIDTLEELRRLHPGAAFELLVGADMLKDLPHWRRAREIVDSALVVGFGRPGAAADGARRAFEAAFGPGRHAWLDLDPVPASSTDVRRRLAAGEPLGGLLDPAVEAFIRARGLYGAGVGMGG